MLDHAELQQLRHRHGEGEGRQREVDAGQPQRGKTEQEADDEADDAGGRQRQDVVDAAVFDQDRGSVGADSIERALPERELAAAAGEDVERQHGDAVDQQHRHLEDDEVSDEQRQGKQDDQHHP